MNEKVAESIFMGNLSRLHLETEYRSTKNDPVENFYKKCLRDSASYQRAVGYFRSSVLIIIGKALVDFVRKGGRIQLICSPSLSSDDIRSISAGYARRDEVIAASLVDEFDKLLAEPETEFAARALATLVALGALEIKIAELKNGKGIYHEKLGIFSDGLGDLPPGRPSFITRVLGVDRRRLRVGQARGARSPQIAQALGALLRAFGFPARNAA